MNKFLSILAFLICSNIITVFAQNTTLVVDNQNPGWLSSKIPFKDQESVKNLTVTGYLNGTDIKFIRELLNNRQLSHLDLSDANIVAGGDAYYDNKYYTADNQLTPYIFHTYKSIDFLATPKSTVKEREYLTYPLHVDTLIVGGKGKVFDASEITNTTLLPVDRLIIREGIESFIGNSNEGMTSPMGSVKFIQLPSSLKSIGKQACMDCENLQEINLPDNIESIGEFAFAGTNMVNWENLLLPKKLKSLYFNSFPMHLVKYIKIPKSVEYISNINPTIYNSAYKNIKIIEPSMNIEIHTENPTPVKINAYGGEMQNLKGCTIYVPKGSANDYKNQNYFSKNNDNVWSYATIIEEKVPVTGVTLNQENISFTEIGASIQLAATVLPENADNPKVQWTSSNTNVATVDGGNVTCKGYGTAIISATTEDGGFTATCNVTATKKEIFPTSIILDKKEVSIKVGETATINANVQPVDADNKTIIWSSSNEDIASVTNEGVVTGHKSGTARIIATTQANNLKAECMTTIIQPVTGITIDKQNISLERIGEYVQLTANVLPEDASNKNVTWASSDTKVAIVSNGKTVCTGYGTAVISAVTEDGGYMATCIINATNGIYSITTDYNSKEVKRYDSTGREVSSPVNGLNIIKLEDGRVIKKTIMNE